MIKIVAVGQIKEKYLREAIDDYTKRISRYTTIKIIEIKSENHSERTKNIIKEGTDINRYISDKDYIVTLEIEGKQYTSEQFAQMVDHTLIKNSNLTFVIGGSYGLSDEIKKRSNLHLSFSKMTFPHQLFRLVLLEQIYRVYKINNNESYHK